MCQDGGRQRSPAAGATDPEPADYALATIAVILDHPVSHSEAEMTLVEEKP
jgi:hypothetical protein